MDANHWQGQFGESLLNGLQDPLRNTFAKTQGPEHAKRFAIYQNNVFYSLTQALSDLYPVIKQLVGEDFFQALAKCYIQQHPPQQAAMVFFAWDFSEFLRSFEHTQSLPYLAGVAELELARHKAYHAADLQSLGPEDFAKLSPSEFESCTVKLHPSVHIIAAQYPIFSIWQMNHSDNEADAIELDHAEQVIVARINNEVTLFSVDAGTYEFYRCLQRGLPVHAAATAAQQKSDTNIANTIAFGINNALVTELAI